MAMAMATMMATSNSSIRGPWRCPKPAASQRPGPFPRPSLAARCGPFALNGSALTRCRTSMAPIGLPIALRVNEVPAKWGPTIWSSCFPWKNCHRYIQKDICFLGYEWLWAKIHLDPHILDKSPGLSRELKTEMRVGRQYSSLGICGFWSIVIPFYGDSSS